MIKVTLNQDFVNRLVDLAGYFDSSQAMIDYIVTHSGDEVTKNSDLEAICRRLYRFTKADSQQT